MPGKKSYNNDDFFNSVYKITSLIPFGSVTSYGAIARYPGSGKSARTVGWALSAELK
jgi:methylated-DNA-protein-cysteine methyltransferase-like protein